MFDKIKTLIWFIKHPSYWDHAIELILRKFRSDLDGEAYAYSAKIWAKERVSTVSDALISLGFLSENSTAPQLSKILIDEAKELEKKSPIEMGGPGDIDLIYAAVLLSGAKSIIETGIGYGWSSLAILAALENEKCSKLISVDMPYPKLNNEASVGIIVPNRLRDNWIIIRKPDRKGLLDAINLSLAKIDLCHYDSDKSWWGRDFAFPLLWDALRPGGLFISDDIQDNMYFARFSEKKGTPMAVVEFDGKFIGLLRKPI